MKFTVASTVTFFLTLALAQATAQADHTHSAPEHASATADKNLRGLTANDSNTDQGRELILSTSGNLGTGTTTCMCITAPCDCSPNDTPLLDESDLTECPVIGPAVTCTMEYQPYICGELNCKYGNACTAAGAGWNVEEQCELETPAYTYDDNGCPITGPAVTCIEIFQPHLCSLGEDAPQCEYANACLAEGAGWDVSAQCEAAVFKPRSTCPTPTAPCSRLYEPFVCSKGEYEGCEYQNKCLARAAGFLIRKHCKKVIKN
jgi:hypothetical protein